MYYVKWIIDVKWLKICILNTSWIKLEISLSYLLYHLNRINFNQLHLGQWVKYGDLLFVTCISIKTCRWAGWCKTMQWLYDDLHFYHAYSEDIRYHSHQNQKMTNALWWNHRKCNTPK